MTGVALLLAMDQIELISAIDKWQEEGRSLRERLLAERADLTKRLNEVEKRLAMLPMVKQAPVDIGNHPPVRVLPRDSLADVVRKILRAASGRPLAAGEVVDMVLTERPRTEKTHVHSALFRLKEREEIEAIGAPGSQKYLWKRTEE